MDRIIITGRRKNKEPRLQWRQEGSEGHLCSVLVHHQPYYWYPCFLGSHAHSFAGSNRGYGGLMGSSASSALMPCPFSLLSRAIDLSARFVVVPGMEGMEIPDNHLLSLPLRLLCPIAHQAVTCTLNGFETIPP